MNVFFKIAALLLIITFTSCDEIKFPTPVSYFDSPFPKGNRDLTRVLGNEITIRNSSDTLTLKISSNKNANLILNSKTGDTIFYGKVCKFRGLYYFNQKIENHYWIYAVRISDNLVTGLRTGLIQMLAVDNEIKNGNNKKSVNFISPDTTVISLHPDKREIKKLYSSIIDEIIPDTIMNYQEVMQKTEDLSNTVTAIDPEEYDLISKVYPNPATDLITIELQQKGKAAFQLNDSNGKIILEGQLNDVSDKIDISKQRPGIYILTVINDADKQKEIVKIVKTD